MPSIWKPISPKMGKKTAGSYEGNAGQLLDYGNTHTSPRALRTLRVNAEVNLAHKKGRVATLPEIQARHNFTEEAAQSFLRSVQRVMRSKATNKLPAGGKRPAPAPTLISNPTPVPAQVPVLELITQEGPAAALRERLQDIRARYGDEIRVRGEQTSAREGFVYLVTHPCFEGWVKAGMTIDYELRMAAYNVSDPLSRFELAAARWMPSRREAEQRLLAELSEHAQEVRGEWVRMELATAKESLFSL